MKFAIVFPLWFAAYILLQAAVDSMNESRSVVGVGQTFVTEWWQLMGDVVFCSCHNWEVRGHSELKKMILEENIANCEDLLHAPSRECSTRRHLYMWSIRTPLYWDKWNAGKGSRQWTISTKAVMQRCVTKLYYLCVPLLLCLKRTGVAMSRSLKADGI
jgi:hypothetical protein